MTSYTWPQYYAIVAERPFDMAIDKNDSINRVRKKRIRVVVFLENGDISYI